MLLSFDLQGHHKPPIVSDLDYSMSPLAVAVMDWTILHLVWPESVQWDPQC